jgi:hypothetical protein
MIEFNMQKCDQTKYLGVTIDNRLCMNEQSEQLAKKLTNAISAARVLKKNDLDKSALMKFYHANFHSHLSYCAFTLIRSGVEQLKRLQVIQNRMLKIVLGLPLLTSTLDLYSIHAQNILPVIGVVFHSLILLVKKANVLNNCGIRKLEECKMNRTMTYKTARYTRDILKFDYSWFGVKLFNQLPENIKKIDNFKKFSKEVKAYLLDNINSLINRQTLKDPIICSIQS